MRMQISVNGFNETRYYLDNQRNLFEFSPFSLQQHLTLSVQIQLEEPGGIWSYAAVTFTSDSGTIC